MYVKINVFFKIILFIICDAPQTHKNDEMDN